MRKYMEQDHPLNICKKEESDKIVNGIQSILGEDMAAIALLMTYNQKKTSPSGYADTSIGWLEELGIEHAIASVKKTGNIQKLFLLINSFGGQVASSYKIAAALRENFKRITVFIPHYAASGGTLIALTGNRIIMGEMSSITPIDVQIPKNGEMHSVNSLIRAFYSENALFSETHEDDAPYHWKAMANKFDPVELQDCYDISDHMRKHALEILKHPDSSFTDTADGIVEKLNERFPTHQTSIRYNEAKDIFGEKFCIKQNLNDKCSTLWKPMQSWFENYLALESESHIIRYVLPKEFKPEAS